MGAIDNARLRCSACTSVGRVRENNEDNIQLWQQEHYVIAVVADGMGGAAAGEQASQIAVEAIEAMLAAQKAGGQPFEQRPDEQVISILLEAIRTANSNIIRRATDEPELRGMGTTMTVAYVRPNRALIAHVGDSRAYLVDSRGLKIQQVTADHSFVEALVAAGHLTHEQAEEHPMRNVLYRALGQNEDVDIDLYEIRLRSGDRLVMCSDGLTHHVKAGEIATISSEAKTPDDTCQRLIDLANARGGEDNISVIVIQTELDLTAQATLEIGSLNLVELDVEDTIILRGKLERIDPLHDGDETLRAGLLPDVRD